MASKVRKLEVLQAFWRKYSVINALWHLRLGNFFERCRGHPILGDQRLMASKVRKLGTNQLSLAGSTRDQRLMASKVRKPYYETKLLKLLYVINALWHLRLGNNSVNGNPLAVISDQRLMASKVRKLFVGRQMPNWNASDQRLMASKVRKLRATQGKAGSCW